MNRKTALLIGALAPLKIVYAQTLPRWSDLPQDSLPHPIKPTKSSYVSQEAMMCRLYRGIGFYSGSGGPVSGRGWFRVVGFKAKTKPGVAPGNTEKLILLYLEVDPDDASAQAAHCIFPSSEIPQLIARLQNTVRMGKRLKEGKIKAESFDNVSSGKLGGTSFGVFKTDDGKIFFEVSKEGLIGASCELHWLDEVIKSVQRVKKWHDTNQPPATPVKQ